MKPRNGSLRLARVTWPETVVQLPEIGIRGNTHFPFSDLNNVQITDQVSKFLSQKGLD